MYPFIQTNRKKWLMKHFGFLNNHKKQQYYKDIDSVVKHQVQNGPSIIVLYFLPFCLRVVQIEF